MGYGKKVWIFPDAELPPKGENEIPGHESIIITNTGDKDAHVQITLFYPDRPPVKEICVTVEAQRVRCLRTNEEKDFGQYTAAFEEQYAIMAYTITGIGASLFDNYEFAVTPYWITLDGTTVKGVARERLLVSDQLASNEDGRDFTVEKSTYTYTTAKSSDNNVSYQYFAGASDTVYVEGTYTKADANAQFGLSIRNGGEVRQIFFAEDGVAVVNKAIGATGLVGEIKSVNADAINAMLAKESGADVKITWEIVGNVLSCSLDGTLMYTIKAKPITAENFKPYGTFASMLEPTGPSLGDFYNDQVEFPVSGNLPIAFSPLVVHRGEMLVTMAEYHDTTCEGVLPMDDDVVLHVAPATKEPVPELTEAFIVPKGTMVKLNVGVWHLAAMPIHLDTAHVMITLPERIYKTDCVVVDYQPEQYVKIEL